MDEARKRARKTKTADVREQVMKRADDTCESCGMGALHLEMDHFFGGSLKRILERLETCWVLCRMCHHLKTNNSPDRAHWLKRFIEHATRHDYAAEADIALGKLEALWLRK
jgi:5-methylcytosine-specific restriction endonuclease McrA